MVLEKDGRTAYHGPACHCSSRATRHVGHLERECEHGHRFHLRVTKDGLQSLTEAEAYRLDRERKSWR